MWDLIIAITFLISLVLVLSLCTCWGTQNQKDDWLGVDGMVTQTNPDENVNHWVFASPAGSVPEKETPTVVADEDNSNRPISSNTQRSLPDIPSEGQQYVGYEPSGDNSSELYATVEPYKRQVLPNGNSSQPGTSSQAQLDDIVSPYASVNYDKLNKAEHPYARVKSNSVETDNDTEILEESVRSNIINGQPSTSRLLESPNNHSRQNSNSSNVETITAATAVAGGVAASQELPYMTPPIVPASQQVNFSGDSVDSSKGYTSISVREPLANIIAQTKEIAKTKKLLDPHYSTVSDDSDEMYTTIPDIGNQDYTSGSETYAQILPVTVTAEINPIPASAIATASTAAVSENFDSAPQPPSVDALRNMSYSHSRQASSSSSILNLGSPKPEKRQANSPLPPPPPTLPSSLEVSPNKNLDDMYAKVHKNRKLRNTADSDSEEIPVLATEPIASTSAISQVVEHNYETLKCPKKPSDQGYERLKLRDDISEPNYASIDAPDSLGSQFPPYETLSAKKSEHGYSTINYATAMAGYSVINKQNKTSQHKKDELNSDPNYESMQPPSEPNYESVRSLDISNNEESSRHFNAGYETVGNATNSSRIAEPPYEKLNESAHNYESVRESGDEKTFDSDEIYQV